MAKVIDLSVSIAHKQFSEEVPAKIRYFNHKQGALLLGLGLAWCGDNIIQKVKNFCCTVIRGRLLTAKDFPANMGLSTEILTLSTHNGTHVDAPAHYGPEGLTIDQVGLDYFYGNGVLLDFRDLEKESTITKEDIQRKLAEINYTLNINDIVLLWTGADYWWGQKEYLKKYKGLSVSGLDYLLGKGIRLIGTDAFGLDEPFQKMMNNYFRSGKKTEMLWPVHFWGRKHHYFMIEKLSNLGYIGMPYGFIVSALPIKIENAGASWARVVAIIPEK